MNMKNDKLKVFISSAMIELRDVREIVAKALNDIGIRAWIYEINAGARPEGIIQTSLEEVEVTDIYVGLFWKNYGKITIKEYLHARELGKPCFIYIRDRGISREESLEDFLKSEVYNLCSGVTYDYFDSAITLGQQIANDIMSWLVRRHREMTAEIKMARIPQLEIENIKVKINKLQTVSGKSLPQGTAVDYLAQKMRAWFRVLGYRFGKHDIREENYFEWVIEIPARRGHDRIFVRGMEGEVEFHDVIALRKAVVEQKTDEGWIVSARRKSQVACKEIEKKENRDLFCYTFDELLDETADFSGYSEWLESEIKRLGIDTKYVPLACVKKELDPVTNQIIAKSRYNGKNGWIDGYIDRWLDDPSKEHISILGEFGTGKTWFALHYAWTILQRYNNAKEKGVERPRLPLVIPLRDYAKAVSMESLFSEFFFRKHEIPLPGYSAFEQLNRMGKLLLIFDGFDEMASKIDRQKMINNFWELAKTVVPGSKVILTCRSEHFLEAGESRALLKAELKASTAKITGKPPQFEVLELEKFDEDQIRSVLLINSNSNIVDKVMKNKRLVDLARRPVMIELILESLPEIEADKPIDLSRIYLYAVHRKMEHDIKAERTFTSLADKLYFLCEISWEMLANEQMSLNYRLFPERLRRMFGPEVEKQKELDHWHYDMMGQTMLVRNEDGDYQPAHRSLLEFFVAYKYAAELGLLPNDFLLIAKDQSNINNSLKSQAYQWHSYFQRDKINIKKAPLDKFSVSNFQILTSEIGKFQFTKTILEILVDIISINDINVQKSLLNLIGFCKNKEFKEINHFLSNLILILVTHNFKYFRNNDLSNLCFRDFNINNLRSKFEEKGDSRSNYDFIDFSGTNFENSDLTNASFGNPAYSDVKKYPSNLIKTNFKNCILENFEIPHYQLNDISLNEKNRLIALGSHFDLILLDIDSFKVMKRIYDNGIWHVQFSPDNKYIVHSDFGSYKIRDGNTLDLIFEQKISKRYNPNSSEKDNYWTGQFCFSKEQNLIAVGCNNSFIYLYDFNKRKELKALKSITNVDNVSFSPDSKYLVSSGFREFILWDINHGKKLKHGYYTDKNSLEKYNAKFHTSENVFALTHRNKIKFYSIDESDFISEIDFSGADKIDFSSNGSILAVSGKDKIILIDFNDKKVLNTISLDELDLEKKYIRFFKRDFFIHIENLAISENDKYIYCITHNGMLFKLNIETEKIENVYMHLIELKGTNFNSAKGLDRITAEQIYKNGGIINPDYYN